MVRKMLLEEKALTEEELRKLNALRKSLGEEEGEEAFLAWLARKTERVVGPIVDRNAEKVAAAVERLLSDGKIRNLNRGGYIVKRGRGRVIVEMMQG